MSGHSHWAGIKYKKALADAKRGKLFSKIVRRIMIAARSGGGDPDSNLELRYAIDDARAANMPKDNVARAIKKGTGDLPGVTFEPAVYEGYGPGGVAILVETLTDNRNRTTAEIRKIFDRQNGNLGESGCVSWMFDKKGAAVIEAAEVDEDDLLMVVLEAGAEDMTRSGETFEITTDVANLRGVKEALETAGYEVSMAEVRNIPKSVIDLDIDGGRKVIRLLDALDDHDDVQTVSANFNLPDEVMAAIAEEVA